MRWIPFLVFSYIMLLLQCSIGRILVFHFDWPGPFGPDVLLIFAVFVFLISSDPLDGILAGCIIGFIWDLGMAASACCVGPMAIICAFCSWPVMGIREALFRNRVLPQMILTAMFVAFAHGMWITVQTILGGFSWSDYARLLLMAFLSVICTVLLTPVIIVFLKPFRKWIVLPIPSLGRRRRTLEGFQK